MNQTRPKNYLIEAILVTLFYCKPFGIVGIVFASQVNSKYSLGDYKGTQQASINAKKWMNWGIIAGVIIVIGVFVLYGSIFAIFLSKGSF